MDKIILERLGARIRLYRKSCGLSLEELAGRVHKSKASISKYELGQIAMDVLTLSEIAAALGVSPFRLLEPETAPQTNGVPASHPFGRADTLYLYHMSRGRVYPSLMKIGPLDDSGAVHATLYYRVDALREMTSCHCVYHGHMFTHEMVLSFFLRNHHNATENVLLNFSIPMHSAELLTGMISGLDESVAPTARQIILSTSEQPVDERLMSAMQISPEALREAKRINALSIRPNSEP